MLVPKEKPHINGLNSYYLQIANFIEHLQGEIGSGCLYCSAPSHELLVFFEEREIIRSITQQSGEKAKVYRSIQPVLDCIQQRSFDVTVYLLDPSSIFFWGQIPSFKRAKARLTTADIPLPDLIFRLRQKKFSGFVDISFQNGENAGLLFFHDGERRGGSYSWGNGGLTTSDDDYNRLLGLLQTNIASYDVGHFESAYKEETVPEQNATKISAHELKEHKAPPDATVSNFDLAINEFMSIYIQLMGTKSKKDPILLLKQEFIEQVARYPVVDPFRNHYQIDRQGNVKFSPGAPKKEILSAMIDCTWNVITHENLFGDFNAALNNWPHRTILARQGIETIR